MSRLTLKNFDSEAKLMRDKSSSWIKVGLSTCGIASGADKVYAILKKELEKRSSDVPVLKCGCAGMCYAEPLVEVAIKGMPRVLYGNVDEAVALRIVRRHIVEKQIINDHIYSIKEE
jgi:NADP-reducing hydrogenase subunit HndB